MMRLILKLFWSVVESIVSPWLRDRVFNMGKDARQESSVLAGITPEQVQLVETYQATRIEITLNDLYGRL